MSDENPMREFMDRVDRDLKSLREDVEKLQDALREIRDAIE